MASLNKPSVEDVAKKITNYISRPLLEFNKYEALEMLDTLQGAAHDNKHDKANFYKVAFQTARTKIDIPKEQFRHLLMRLVGDKDHEKVLDVLRKVEKECNRQSGNRAEARPAPYRRYPNRLANNWQGSTDRRCYYCGRVGHVKFNCELRKKDMQGASTSINNVIKGKSDN
jgi:uncharacterized protein (UPF0128 family)